ncbi:MAG: hypothetical protein METHAR1v1_1520001, partial [Methanothrix sp.]
MIRRLGFWEFFNGASPSEVARVCRDGDRHRAVPLHNTAAKQIYRWSPSSGVGVGMVEVHKVSGSPFDGNVYLILDEVPILVDAGMEPESTLRKIKKYIDPQEIEMIVLTHCHHDHSAGV